MYDDIDMNYERRKAMFLGWAIGVVCVIGGFILGAILL